MLSQSTNVSSGRLVSLVELLVVVCTNTTNTKSVFKISNIAETPDCNLKKM